ncbi:MAG: nitroreductase family protein, partial [Ruminococcus sp.]|nr:nitroreductase family protein [Ruminococcus sp.]
AGNGWGFYDLGLQNENLVLKAKDMGLDTLIMGIRDEKKIRTMLSIPEEQIIVAVIAVGYSDAKPDMPKRKNIEEIVSFF